MKPGYQIDNNKDKNNKQGSVLIVVLIVLSLLMAILYSITTVAIAQIKISQSCVTSIKAYWLAAGGMERLKNLLSADNLSIEAVKNISGFNKEASEETLPVDGTLRYSIYDERSLLSLNSSDPQVWLKYEQLDRYLVQSIVDWIDEDNIADIYGAEEQYYRQKEIRYRCKNKPIEYIRELLFIRGISKDRYYQPKKQQQDRLNPVDDSRQSFVENFSASKNPKLNINTTSFETLEKLQGLTSQAVYAVKEYLERDKANCFKSRDDFEKLSQLSNLDRELLGQYCCFNSDIFRLFSFASVKDSVCEIMATVKINNRDISIISVERIR